jgi:tetratricopeptide (TPR) repeat protein
MKKWMLLGVIVLTHFVAIAQSAKQLGVADSLFLVGDWKNAAIQYEAVLPNLPNNGLGWSRLGFAYHNTGDYEQAIASYMKALQAKPTQQLQASVYARLTRSYAKQNKLDLAIESLEKALDAEYSNLSELESSTDLENVRRDPRFSKLILRTRENAFPCLTQSKLREFDFWIGEWTVYPNGSKTIVGNSRVEMASGGCMILENWTAVGATPNEGKSMNYVNHATGKWEQLWIGSGGITANNPQRFVNGDYRDKAMRFEYEQTSPQGRKQIGRFTFFNEGNNRVRQLNEVSSDNGKTWSTVYDFVYVRKD